MNVKNRKCIRKLSLKSLYANRRRNLIAIFAIALTTQGSSVFFAADRQEAVDWLLKG